MADLFEPEANPPDADADDLDMGEVVPAKTNGAAHAAPAKSDPPPSSRSGRGPSSATALEAALAAAAESDPPPPSEVEPTDAKIEAEPEPHAAEAAPSAKAAEPNAKAGDAKDKKGKKNKKDKADKKAREARPFDAQFEEEVSGVSDAFFNSIPPAEPDPEPEVEIAEPQRVLSMTPEAIAHRAKLRKIVVGVVIGASVLALIVVGKFLLFGAGEEKKASASVPVSHEAAPPPVEPKEEPAPAANAEPAPAPEPAPADEEAEDEAADEETAEEAKADDAEEAIAAEDEGKDGEALRKEALTLLNKGQLKDVLGKARAAIKAEPQNALAYLYLGSALQDLGQWNEAMGAYNDCVKNAKVGPVHECIAMGGRK